MTDYSNSTTTITYDNLGRALTQSVPFENISGTVYYAVTKTDYDRNDNVILTRGQNNEPGAAADWWKATSVYNNRNFLTTVSNYLDDVAENVVTYTYNGAGSVLTQTTGTHTIEYTYDRYQNISVIEDALSQTEEYAYTPNGSLLSKTDRNGIDFTYGVDGLGRTLTIGANGGVATQSHTTTYNYGGQATSISADGVTTSYTYDGYGRVLTETTAVSLGASGIPSSKAFTYDLSGRILTSAITVNGDTNTTSYTYDRLGRVVTVKDGNETEATYTYDANGNRASMTLSNGAVTTYTYNLANLVKTLINKDESNNTLSSCSYLYRLDGNQVGKQEGTKTTLYAYDDLGRLTAESVTEDQTTVVTGYTFDAYNNRATKTIGALTVATYTYDANDRMLTETTGEGTTNYTYDNNGSQLTATIGASVTTNTYDLFGQLTSYTDAESVVANYTYGPDGLRTSKTSGNTATTFVWDGGNITNEFISVTEGENTTTTENRYVNGVGRVKAFLGAIEVYYLYNARGDVTGLTDSSCDLIKSYVYDAFGIEVDIDSADANPFRYCGEYYDKETETYYLRARYYKPNTGRFTQQDSWGYVDMADPLSLNLYLYCNNNPVNYVDPSGHTLRLPEDDIENDIERESGSIEFENATETDIEKFWEAIDYLMNSPTAKALIEFLMNSDIITKIHFIHLNDFIKNFLVKTFDYTKIPPPCENAYEKGVIYWDPDLGMLSGDGGYVVSAAICLAHEMGHAAQVISGDLEQFLTPVGHIDNQERDIIEILNLVKYEIPIEKELNEWVRYDYLDTLGHIKVDSPTEHGMISTSYWWFFKKQELGPIQNPTIKSHPRKGSR